MQIIEVFCAVYCQNFKLHFLIVSKKSVNFAARF